MACAWALFAGASAAAATDGPAPLREDLAALVEAANGGDRVMLLPARYRAGLVVRKPVTLVGQGAGVTVLVGGLTFAGGGGAEALTVDGAGEGCGLVVRGTARLSAVVVRNERADVVRVLPGASLSGEDVSLACGGEVAATGLRVSGAAHLVRLAVDGPCRRSVDVAGAHLSLEGATLTGAAETGVRVVDGVLDWTGGRVSLAPTAAGAAGLFAARSRVTVRDVAFVGGEQGVLTRGGRTTLADVTVEGARAAGLAFVQGHATVERAHLSGPFSHAAVLAAESPKVVLRQLEVTTAGAAGLLAVRSSVEVEGMQVAALACDREGDFGHALVFERSQATVLHLVVTDAPGALVWASASQVTVTGATGERVALGLAATGGAEVTARLVGLSTPGAVGVLAWGSSRVVLDRPISAQVEAAACAGSTVTEAVVGQPVRACTDEALAHGWRQALSP